MITQSEGRRRGRGWMAQVVCIGGEEERSMITQSEGRQAKGVDGWLGRMHWRRGGEVDDNAKRGPPSQGRGWMAQVVCIGGEEERSMITQSEGRQAKGVDGWLRSYALAERRRGR